MAYGMIEKQWFCVFWYIMSMVVQLKPEFQNIITKYRAEFETPDSEWMICQKKHFFFLKL